MYWGCSKCENRETIPKADNTRKSYTKYCLEYASYYEKYYEQKRVKVAFSRALDQEEGKERMEDSCSSL